MKRLLFLMFLVISVNVFAQTEKNKVFLTGTTNASLFFSKTEGSDNETTNVNISPASGYFIVNNVALGASFLFSYSKVAYPYSSSESTIYQFSPFLRFYFPSENRISKFFIHLEGGYAELNNKEGNFISGKIGSAFFFNQHVSFDVGASYTRSQFRNIATNTFGLELGLSVYLGKN